MQRNPSKGHTSPKANGRKQPSDFSARRITILEETNQRLQTKLQDSEAEKTKLRSEVKALASTISIEREARQKETQKHESILSALTVELDALRTRLAAEEKDKSVLTTQLETLRHELDRNTEKMRRIEDLEISTARQGEREDRLRKEANEAKRQAREYKEELEQLQREMMGTEDSLEHLADVGLSPRNGTLSGRNKTKATGKLSARSSVRLPRLSSQSRTRADTQQHRRRATASTSTERPADPGGVSSF